MSFLYIFLCLLSALLVVGHFANRARIQSLPDFELTPNCLLTRWPLVFVSGTQSIFYTKKYWNLYPIFLAEHGYEVFHLGLPSKKGTARIQFFKKFLEQEGHKPLHLIFDQEIYEELKSGLNLDAYADIRSITVMTDRPLKNQKLSPSSIPHEEILTEVGIEAKPITKAAYRLHQLFFGPCPSLSTLGACADSQFQNAEKLLVRAQRLAERDLIDGDTL